MISKDPPVNKKRVTFSMQAIELIRACPKKTVCLICRGVMQAMRKSKSSDIDRNILLNINIKIACKEALISKNKND